MTDTWSPNDLCVCVGSDILGWLTGVLSAGMLVWYTVIAMKWDQSRKLASDDGKKIWGWLIIIFVICSLGGYVALTVALFAPKIAVVLRITALILQNIACPIFWHISKHYRFGEIGKFENVGKHMVDKVTDDMSDRELASYARTVISRAITRTAKEGL